MLACSHFYSFIKKQKLIQTHKSDIHKGQVISKQTDTRSAVIRHQANTGQARKNNPINIRLEITGEAMQGERFPNECSNESLCYLKEVDNSAQA